MPAVNNTSYFDINQIQIKIPNLDEKFRVTAAKNHGWCSDPLRIAKADHLTTENFLNIVEDSIHFSFSEELAKICKGHISKKVIAKDLRTIVTLSAHASKACTSHFDADMHSDARTRTHVLENATLATTKSYLTDSQMVAGLTKLSQDSAQTDPCLVACLKPIIDQALKDEEGSAKASPKTEVTVVNYRGA